MEYEKWAVEQVRVKIELEFGEDVAKFVGKPYSQPYYLNLLKSIPTITPLS